MSHRFAHIIIAAALLSGPAFAGSSPDPQLDRSWSCEESNWAEEPQMNDGAFNSTRAVKCKVKSSLQIGQIFESLKHQVENSKQIQILRGPASISDTKGNELKYFVQDNVTSDSDPVQIEEEITLKTENGNLSYNTYSKNIHGTGNASYLKKLTFGFQVKPHTESGYYEVQLRNTIQVEHPWFAPLPIFKAIAKDKAVSKFESAREEFLSKLFSNSSQNI
jgi:hypothetical protein